MDENAKNQIKDLSNRIEQIESNLNSAKKIVKRLESEYLKVDYTQIEGIAGTYDGYNLVTKEGEKYEVPANYAAKSKLVYGDILKLVEEGGRKLFKQVEKVNRERVEGILTKKDGEWFLLTDRGSYRVSDAAAEFQNAQLNSQATAFLPSDNMDAPFATLDIVEGQSVIGGKKPPEKKEEEKPQAKQTEKPVKKTTGITKKKEEDLKDLKSQEIDLKKKEEKVEKKVEEKVEKRTEKRPAPRRPARKAVRPRPRPAVSPRKTEESREEVTPNKQAVLDDDDLV